VDDILTLSRIEKESELKEVSLETLPLKPVIESAISANLPKAKEKNIKIEVSFPDKLKAKINERLLEQAISNLIDNAIKYSDEGKEITIKGEETNSNIIIQVADEGYGIEAEHIPRLFERFYRVDKSRSRQKGGTGLGLAIVKHIAILHGGRVGVESTPGKGSIFSIFLPKV
jgi:two-component system phosphate regulon sensor histidine kinase PhoR